MNNSNWNDKGVLNFYYNSTIIFIYLLNDINKAYAKFALFYEEILCGSASKNQQNAKKKDP